MRDPAQEIPDGEELPGSRQPGVGDDALVFHGPRVRDKSRRAVPSVTQRALGLLTRREHSRKELVQKLTSRGMEAAEVESAVNRLANDGWQDDARFAESLVRARASSGYGPIRLRAELATHGLDRDAVARALDSFSGDWAEIASDLVRRRFGPVANFDLTRRRKAVDFLIRRGFDRAALQAALQVPDQD